MIFIEKKLFFFKTRLALAKVVIHGFAILLLWQISKQFPSLEILISAAFSLTCRLTFSAYSALTSLKVLTKFLQTALTHMEALPTEVPLTAAPPPAPVPAMDPRRHPGIWHLSQLTD